MDNTVRSVDRVTLFLVVAPYAFYYVATVHILSTIDWASDNDK